MGRPSRSIQEVAATLLSKAIPNGECLDYHLSTDSGGYGQTYYGSAHRVVWIGRNGPTNGLHVLHRCDNRRCINPAHLFLGTGQDNVDDMIAKGRKVIPEQYKLINETERAEINQMYAEGYSTAFIAEMYGVSKSTIKRNLGERYDPYR